MHRNGVLTVSILRISEMVSTVCMNDGAFIMDPRQMVLFSTGFSRGTEFMLALRGHRLHFTYKYYQGSALQTHFSGTAVAGTGCTGTRSKTQNAETSGKLCLNRHEYIENSSVST